MGKVNKYKRGIAAFISSEKGQRFFNFAYSIGAAIVIWGALFKILHLPGGNALLSIGMGTEVLMFVLTAFDRPPKEYHWEDVFPVLDSRNPEERPAFGGGGSGGGVVVGGGAGVGSGGSVVVGDAETEGVTGGEGGTVIVGGGSGAQGGTVVVGGGSGAQGGTVVVGGGSGTQGGTVVVGGGSGGGVVFAGGSTEGLDPDALAALAESGAGGGVVGGVPGGVVGGFVGGIVGGFVGGMPAGMAGTVPTGEIEGAQGAVVGDEGAAMQQGPIVMGGVVGGGIQAPIVTAETRISDVVNSTQTYLDQMASLATEMQHLKETTAALNTVSDTLLQSYEAITQNSTEISTSSTGYVEQMQNLNHNINGLNTIYEIQLKSVASQLDAIDRVNRGIKDIRDMFEKSAAQSVRYCEETEKMARYMQQLNQVYEKMITAMTINMYNPMMPTAAAPQPQPEDTKQDSEENQQ